MAAVIESNFETEEQLREALSFHGYNPMEVKPTEEATPPKAEESEQAGTPGDKVSAEPDGESATGTEPAEPRTQEAPEGGKPKPKGGYQYKIDKLTERVDSLRERLEEEEGDKRRLKEQLEAAQEELTAFRAGKVSEEPAKDAGPKKPKRPEVPELAAYEYDADKFAEAQRKYRADMDKWDEAMDTYFQAVATKTAEERIAAERISQEEASQVAEMERQEQVAVDMHWENAKLYPDYNDIRERFNEAVENGPKPAIDASEAAQAYMRYKADEKAGLTMYFMRDYLENDGKEGKRIAAIPADDITKLIRELGKIEDRLVAERTTPKKTEAAAPAAPPAKKPEPRKVPEAPIEPARPGITPVTPGNLLEQVQAAAERAAQTNSPEDARNYRMLVGRLQAQERAAKGGR